MVRNADKYYFPIKECILSILPIVDEYIVALGDSDPDDNTRAIIESIQSPKIKIYDRVWSEKEFIDGKIFANETTFALQQCTGDWCISLQADEVIHEKDHEKIKTACKKFLNEKNVDGFLFHYYHFFGDYNHHLPGHGLHHHEIRLVRGKQDVYSYMDCHSFRKGNDQKLNIVNLSADIFHYGWVRPPRIMQLKKKEQDTMHHGRAKTELAYQVKEPEFNYGALGLVPEFDKSHPAVMKEFISKMDWREQLNYSKKATLTRPKFKHEKIKYRILTFLENIFNGGKTIGGLKNWNLVK